MFRSRTRPKGLGIIRISDLFSRHNTGPRRRPRILSFGYSRSSSTIKTELKQRVAFERLVASISSDLAGARSEDVDPVIRRALEAIGRHVDADRAYVFQRDGKDDLFSNTHEWCATGIAPQIDNLQHIDVHHELPWFGSLINRRIVVHVSDVSTLPEEASLEKAHFAAQEIQSLVVVPMESAGRLTGFLGFDSVRRRRSWEENDRALLKFVGDLFSHALGRRDAEFDRATIRALLEAAIAQSPSGILIADAPDVTIRLANPAALGIRGGEREKLVGIAYHEHATAWQVRKIDGSPYPSEELPLSRAVLRGEVTLSEDVCMLDRHGKRRWLSVNAAPIRDAEGNIVSGIMIFQDLTGRKKAEQRQKQLEEVYRQAQKMEAIGQLTGGVAHDFNNLLQVINGATDLALAELPRDHVACELLADVAIAGARAAELVSQLLMFSRRQIMKPEELRINDVIEELLKMVTRLIGERIMFSWDAGTDVELIRADRSMIEQAMLNLCVNARDAMPNGGILSIETCNATIGTSFCSTRPWAVPGRYVCIRVGDTGHGIDNETRRRIFEPFFTTKTKGKGTGLGLSTVYGIVKQHHGMIDVVSTPEVGTAFILYLPSIGTTQFQSPEAAETGSRRGATAGK